MANDHYNIRWKNHSSAVLQSMFRYLNEERLCDLTLACEGGFVKCHRLVLSACSSYFERLLGELQSESNLVVFMKDMKLWELQALVRFMYHGEVSVKQSRLAPLIRAAESLKIRGLSNDKEEENHSAGQDYDGEEGTEKPGYSNSTKSSPVVRKPSPSLETKNLQGVKRGPTGNNNMPPLKLLKPLTKTGTNGTAQAPPKPAPRTILKSEITNGRRTMSTESDGSNENANNGKSSSTQVKIDSVKKETQRNMEGGGKSPEGTEDSVDSSDMVMDEEAYEEDGEDQQDDSAVSTTISSAPVKRFDSRPSPQQFQIMDPPMVGPVADSVDRLNRLKKATALALAGCTVRQAAAHYSLPRTTLCAYMKRQGIAGRRASNATPSMRNNDQNEEEQESFQFLGGFADLMGNGEDMEGYEQGADNDGEETY